MKQKKRILKGGRILGLFLALGLMLAPVLSARCVHAADADEPYTYTVRVFAGNRGTISGKAEFTGLKEGDSVPFDFTSQVTVKSGEPYYAKGLREAGKDTGAYMTSIPAVTGDRDYVIAYGMKGATVAYTVNYVTPAGRKLADSQTFYGNVGDQPIVTYKYVEGYFPNARNLTKIKGLSGNASENVFDFVYQPNPVSAQTVNNNENNGQNQNQNANGDQNGQGQNAQDNDQNGQNAGGQGQNGQDNDQNAQNAQNAEDQNAEGQNAGQNGNAGDEGQNAEGAGDQNLPASPDEVPEIADIDDPTVPLAGGDGEESSSSGSVEEPAEGKDGQKADADSGKLSKKTIIGVIIIVAAVIVALLAILAIIRSYLRRKRK